MPGGHATCEHGSLSVGGTNACVVSSSIVGDGEESSSGLQKTEKDPRRMARKYQLELCKKALEENIIVYLGTGCGKTHIAVLLIYEMGHLIRQPQKSACVFLAPTVALVNQQAKVIEDSTDFKVGVYCGNSNRLKTHSSWEKEIEQYEVLVMTPQILLYNLSHSFIKMDLIALLIFDECHHAQVKSSHPYAQIMKVFYKPNDGKLPRIFGMTASPVVGKGASSRDNLPRSINSLENLLDAKVYSVEDKEELESFVASPVIRVYSYGPVANGTSSSYEDYYNILQGFKHQCIVENGSKTVGNQSLESLRSTKKVLIRMHESIIFCLENLGLWGALQACRILLSGDHSEWNALIEAEGNISDVSVCDRYLNQAANVFAADCTRDGIASTVSQVEVLKEPFFSEKLLCLVRILSNFRLQPDMKCIVFVNRIVTARSLSHILQNLKFLTSWKCDFLVGVHSGLKSMSRKTMNVILERFRTGKLNLLIATKVGEEGLDIQTCCLVIRFDLPETVASFIQSRGRARMPQSEYAFLVDRGNQKERDLIEKFKIDEARMNIEICDRTSNETFDSIEEKIYKVHSTGASITSGLSISLLQQYCSKLPHDEYFDPKPKFFYFDDSEGTVCHLILPSNAPIHKIVGSPQSSIEVAKKDACLKAIEQLHKLGALSEFLLPQQEDTNELELASSVVDDCEDKDSRGELCEMLVPAVLKESWTELEKPIHLNSYYVQFCPVPEDRIYKQFGLFLKAPLPLEADKMSLELHLARGRSVMTKLVPSGLSEFSTDEITYAKNFQEMFLKAILDRSEFVHEYVPLGKNALSKSCPTFYLLLPVIFHVSEMRVTVDWKIIRRCLFSPIFKNPANAVDMGILPSDDFLHLANGRYSIRDVENSLVYTPHQKKFYFIDSIVPEKNGNSPCKGSNNLTHKDHLTTTFGIHLRYPAQSLLRAKQLFCLRNLLCNRKKEDSELQELDEHFVDLAPELCELKIIGFSKDFGSSISLLPSIMHRLENLLVAIELKCILSASFSEGDKVTAHRVLEALTTEKCQERLSLERLETLGDAFLKFAVGRHFLLLHDTLDEGELTRKRSNAVNNSNLFKLASRNNLQVFIRDQPFDPYQFFSLGRPCPRICTKESEGIIHSNCGSHVTDQAKGGDVRCSKGHHWLHKKTVSDVVEALVGAFLVDSGFKAAIAFLRWIGIKVDFDDSQVINICQASRTYAMLNPSMDLTTLENLLGHRFLYKGLLIQAFVHPSHKNGGGCYQRLEFLGDAVLDYLITSYLFSAYPKMKPGQLTDLRSVLVNNRAFASISVDRSFHEYIICDSDALSAAIQNFVDFVRTPESERHLLEGPKCPKVLGDLVESSVGAILLDTGFDLNHIWKIMLSFLDPIKSFSNLQINPVRELKEICQSHNWDFEVPASKKGRTFSVDVKLSGKDMNISACASNSNKKEAIRMASEKIYARLKDQGLIPMTNSLEEVLRNSKKMEAKLIGYDETPIDVAPEATGFENSKIQEPFDSNCSYEVRPCIKAFNARTPSPLDFTGSQSSETTGDLRCDRHMNITGKLDLGTARSRLHEICMANSWKPPLFECCAEEGPGVCVNMVNSCICSFTYKVVVEIEEAPDKNFECVGSPQMKKKAAAENAAEGALWHQPSHSKGIPCNRKHPCMVKCIFGLNITEPERPSFKPNKSSDNRTTRLTTLLNQIAHQSGINQQVTLTPEMKQAETKIKRRVGIGMRISERKLIDELARMGMNESVGWEVND
ncbi:DICER-RELATED [Salix purpurea]|uniref:DICER-RELATED n=1 Tax=Salix purpurea TaxID=77065 RepID=A0A9Q0T2I3_SALPP|nr:DICER-RELATED [Salix purpurea]